MLLRRRGSIRLNRISSDPKPNSTLPSTLRNPSPPQDRSMLTTTIPVPNAGLRGNQPLLNPTEPAKQQFRGIISSTLSNSSHPPPANPFDQRTPPKNVATVMDQSIKQAPVATPLLPSSVSLPPTPSILHSQPPAPSNIHPQPPAPPILHPGWEQGGRVPKLTELRPKVAAAHGWKGWQKEGSPDYAPRPHLHQPKLEAAQDQLPVSGSLSHLLEQQILDRRGEEERGVSPPRLNPGPAMSGQTDTADAPIIIPPSSGQLTQSTTPPLAKQPNQESEMVVCPLCPSPGFVPRTDLDHARNMHR